MEEGGREGGEAYLNEAAHVDVSPMPQEQVILALKERPGKLEHLFLVVHELAGREGGREGEREGG